MTSRLWRPARGPVDQVVRFGRLGVLVGIVAAIAWFAVPVAAQSNLDAGRLSAETYVPDVTVILEPADGQAVSPVTRSAAMDRLGSIDGVVRVVVDERAETADVYHLALVENGNGRRPLHDVAADARGVVTTLAPDATVSVGGAPLVDAAIERRFRTGTTVLAALGAVVGGLTGLVFGWRRGLAAAATLLIAVAVGGGLAGRLIDPFDGTSAATSMPGALAALLVGTALVLRLLSWFRAPIGVDGAETIRRSIADLLPELTLALASVLVAGVLVDLLRPGRSAAMVPLAGAVAAAAVVLALLPAILTVLDPLSDPRGPRSDWMPVSVPDGADLRLLVLCGFGVVLIGLSLFALRSPSRDLLDHHDVSDHEASRVADQLATGGDPTGALVATAGPDNLPADFAGWAALAAERPDVAWVDTGAGRVFASGPVEVDADMLLVPPGVDGVAVIVPSVDARSADGQDLVGRLDAIPLAGGAPALIGRSVDANQLDRSGQVLVLAIVVLAVAGALAAAALTQSSTFAAAVLVLRLVGGGATVGVFRLMVPEATAADTLITLFLLALGVGLFELEYARALLHEGGSPDPPGVSNAAATRLGMAPIGGFKPGANRGQTAATGMVVLGLGGLALVLVAPFGGGPGAGLFGLGLAVVAAVEFLVGYMVLRPALLGQRAAFHTAIRPLRLALHSGNDRRSSAAQLAEDPTWRRIVDDLIQTEFRLQADPQGADLGTVFLASTPLHRQALAQHASMAAAGLRITGRSPQLRSVRTVGGRTQVTLSVTVDHPERHLLDGDGLAVGVRRSERRSGVLWLSRDLDGSYRIAESIELGAVPLDGEPIDLDRLDVDDPAESAGRAGPADHREDAPDAGSGINGYPPATASIELDTQNVAVNKPSG